MNLDKAREWGLSSDRDFRAKATFGVASAALMLLFPIALLNIFQGSVLIGLGSLGIVFMLTLSVWRVYQGQCHQSLILYGLTMPGMVFMISVFQFDGIVGSLWCFPSIVAVYCMLSERRAWVANLFILVVSLPMAVITLPPEHSLRVIATLMSVSVFSAILVRVIDQLNSKLQHQLVHDPLTGLLNRLTLKVKLEHAIERHHNDALDSALLAIDVDHFKSINDRHGHDAGDHALLALSAIFVKNLRAGDYAFRTGGEEFLILLSGSAEAEAYGIAERLRSDIEQASFITNETVTISIGATEHNSGEQWTQWIKRTDDFLFDSKHSGRNCVTADSYPKRIPMVEISKKAIDEEDIALSDSHSALTL